MLLSGFWVLGGLLRSCMRSLTKTEATMLGGFWVIRAYSVHV